MDLDEIQLHRHFRAVEPARYDQAAVLQKEVGRRMLERLQWVRLQPAVAVDIGCATGYCTRLLRDRYPDASVVGLDFNPEFARHYRSSLGWWRRGLAVAADAGQLPLATASCDLLFVNLLIHWSQLPASWFAEFRRVLAANGLLQFSGFGPDTLCELRRSWAAVDDFGHVHAFQDMHDYGDMLLAAGFADPVMDTEHFTLTYRDISALASDLRNSGASNALIGRRRSLTGKHRYAKMVAAYDRERHGGLLPATFEVFYGHAWAPATSSPNKRTAPPANDSIPTQVLHKWPR